MSERLVDPKYDSAFKNLFGNELHSSITKKFIFDITGINVKELTFKNTEFIPEVEGEFKGVVDILCVTEDGKQIMIEIQKCYQKNFSRRLLYYSSKVITQQAKVEKINYDDYGQIIKDVIIIAISAKPLRLSSKSYLSSHSILNNETKKNDIVGLNYYIIDLTKFNIKIEEISKLRNACDVWCFFLLYAHLLEDTQLQSLINLHAWISDVIQELRKYTFTAAEYEQYVTYLAEIMSHDQYLEYARHYAEEEAARAKEEGKLEGILATAKKMSEMGETPEKIFAYTGLSESEYK